MNKQTLATTVWQMLVLTAFVFTTSCSKDIVQAQEPVLDVDVDLSLTYKIVDTGQGTCYNNQAEISSPQLGDSFFGQDACYQGWQPDYRNNDDGTITDLNTGLMWQQTPDLDSKMTFQEALAGAKSFDLAGHSDWRLPTIKELYSLIDFRGSSFNRIAYIDTDYFDFRFGDESQGERLIDAQYWSATEYVGLTMNGDATVFGVNFADGRIKGYPRDKGPFGQPMQQFVRYVRGNPAYGQNDFADNGDGTILDKATGLMWMEIDSEQPMTWEEALNYAKSLEYAGHTDWRLPNAKELQSMLDYSRAPDAQQADQQGPAIDPVFSISEPESWFWTGTTHLEGPRADAAVYICFGQAFGKMRGEWINVHGAGAQRSDPKSGDPAQWPDGKGPQGDEIRIYNYVRCVRNGN